jgi:methylphosphotriester-DNA--protein-cysteine methyltransferase
MWLIIYLMFTFVQGRTFISGPYDFQDTFKRQLGMSPEAINKSHELKRKLE